MNRRTERILDHIDSHPALAEFYANGFSPADARAAAEHLVAPYVENRSRLPTVPMELLFPYARQVATAIRYGKEEALIAAQKVYRTTYRQAPVECLRLFIHEEKGLSNVDLVFWNLFHLERDRAELELEEFVHETLTVLGSLLEGLMKPFILALAAQIDLQGGIPSARHNTFGQALDVVAKEFPPSALDIAGVRVNQWRNVAQHLSYSVEDDLILCRYGSTGQHAVRLDRLQLNGVLMGSSHLWTALKIARELFFLDHFEELRDEGFESQLGAQRQDARLSVLAAGLASQGFTLADVHIDSQRSDIVVQEMSDIQSTERSLHASQAIFPLGEFCPAPMLSVTYRERDGTPALLVISALETVVIAKESGDLAAAAAEMTFIDLKTPPKQ